MGCRISDNNSLWNDGIVPFEINNVDFPVDTDNRAAVQNAINQWNTRSNIQLVARNGERDYVVFRTAATSCSSPVGRRGGEQSVSCALGAGFNMGSIIHEIGHAVGLWHEQSREDRNNFVTINSANIQATEVSQFEQHITDGDDLFTYDYGSIMHYGRLAFSMNGLDTITPTDPVAVIGQRNALSDGDLAASNFMYPDNRFGNLADGRPFWIGNFSRADRAEILFYYPGDGNWWLGSHDANQSIGDRLRWTFAGNTHGANPGDPDFGSGHITRQPNWIGNFSRADRAEILFYYPGDGNWWLGSHDGNQLRWTSAGNTLGFGQIWDGRPFWIGDFNGNGRADVLFYYPGDGNWWLGSHDGNSLQWTFVDRVV
jgi:hypothetical protein